MVYEGSANISVGVRVHICGASARSAVRPFKLPSMAATYEDPSSDSMARYATATSDLAVVILRTSV